MTATATAPGQLAFDPNYYLDCRQPEWEIYEGRGLVRFERAAGSNAPLVFVEDDCVEVIEALRTRADRWTGAKR
jgi:hypothetical protein